MDTYMPLTHSRSIGETAVQFTDENKNRIYNGIKGNRAAEFDHFGRPSLVIFNSNEPGDCVSANLGDFIVYNTETNRYSVESEKEFFQKCK